MRRHVAGFVALLMIGLISVVPGVVAKDKEKKGEPGAKMYTACNIWYEHAEKIYTTLYQKGTIIPAGTEVADVTYGGGGVQFRDVASNTKFSMEWVGKHRPNVTLKQFGERVFTTRDFAALTQGFTQEEIEAIKAGDIRVGMSKAAVLVSAGYPPEVRTASTESNSWVYWHDRFRNFPVEFKDGKVSAVRK